MRTACVSGGGDGEKVLARDGGSGGVVGGGYDDELGAGCYCREETSEGECECVVGLYAAAAAGHHGDRDVIHEEAGGVDQASSPFVEEGAGEQVDGLADAVGEHDLLGREAEVRGDDALGGLALGVVDGEAFGSEFLQRRKDSRTGGEGVLVEVEAQGVAAGEGWVVLGHREDLARAAAPA